LTYLRDYAAGMRLRLGTRVHRIDRTDQGWTLALDGGSLTAAHAVIATGSDAEPVLPSWPGLESFGGTVMHAGRFRNVALRRLPVRWQDVTARAVQRLAFGDLGRFGYPRPARGPFTRQRTDGVTIAVDDGFARALKAGRVVMKPGIDRFDGPLVRFTDGTSCAPGAACLRSSAPRHPRNIRACGSSAWTAASTATCTSAGARPASWPGLSRRYRPADLPPLSARTCRRRRPA